MDKRELIFEVAKEMFKENGYEETGLREIAFKAGVSVGTVYNYFPNKEAIKEAGIEEARIQIRKVASLLRLTTGRKVPQRLQVFAEHLLDFHEEFHWLLNSELKKEWEEIVRDVIKEGSSRGEISKDIPEEFMAKFFVSGLLNIEEGHKDDLVRLFEHISFKD